MEYIKYLKFRELFKKESLGLYEHYKGGIYRVIDLAYETETQDVLVLYEPEFEGGGFFARPYHIFFAKNSNGQNRFQKI